MAALCELSLPQVSSRSESSCSSLYSLVCLSMIRSCLIVSTMFLMSSRTCSSEASLALRSVATVFAIASVSSTTRLTSIESCSCRSWLSAWLQSYSFGKSASKSSSKMFTCSLRSFVYRRISLPSSPQRSSTKLISSFSVSRRA